MDKNIGYFSPRRSVHESGIIVNWWKYTDFKKPKFSVERVEKLMEGPDETTKV